MVKIRRQREVGQSVSAAHGLVPWWWLVWACGGPPPGVYQDAVQFEQALVTETEFEGAFGACGQISAELARGDCQLAVVEHFGRLEESECQRIESRTFSDECIFLLAERHAANEDLPAGLAICGKTHFQKNCWMHLIQIEAHASLEEPAGLAEARIKPFVEADPEADNAFLFWLMRVREQSMMGVALDETMCDPLQVPAVCRRVVESHAREVLSAADPRRRKAMCAAEAGQRVQIITGHAWVPGPITTEVETAWFTESCL